MLSDFEKFLFDLSPHAIKIVDKSIDLKNYVAMDLSVTNSTFKKAYSESSQEFQTYVNNFLLQNKAKIAYGGYNEQRNIYKRSSHFSTTTVVERDIHLGLDLWLGAYAQVYAPLHGTVYGFSDNKGLGNYGPTIILKHNINNVTFFTLYGHLSRESLETLAIGQCFIAGEQIATLGSAEVNGDYPPHLHFQIIKDIGIWTNDYPGVCNSFEKEAYLANCPNPNLLLKIDA